MLAKTQARAARPGLHFRLLPLAVLLLPSAPAAVLTAASLPLTRRFALRVSPLGHRTLVRVVRALGLASAFAVLAEVVGSGSTATVAEASKFAFMAVALIVGFQLNVTPDRLRSMATIVVLALVAIYAGGGGLLLRLGSVLPLRAPDNNSAAIAVFLLSHVVVERRKLPFRALVIAIVSAFAVLVGARLLVLLSPTLLLGQPINLTRRRFLSLVAVAGAAVLLVPKVWTGYERTWSDQVRWEIYSIVARDLRHEGVPLIAEGQERFVSALQSELPQFIAVRLDIQHAHNGYLHVLGCYGILALIAFAAALYMLLSVGWKIGADRLVLLMVVLVTMMLYETLISDARVTYVAFMFIGMSLRHATDDYEGRVQASLVAGRAAVQTVEPPTTP